MPLRAPLSTLLLVSVVASSFGCGDDDGSGSDGGLDAGRPIDARVLDAPGSTDGGGSIDGATPDGGPPSPGELGADDYREGFGRNATGGEGRATYVVTSAAATGPGSFQGAFEPDGVAENVTIVFEVDTVTMSDALRVGSNVTIDGMAGGASGVTFDLPADARRGIYVEDPAENIVIRGINFRSDAEPSGGGEEQDLLALDGTNGSAISNVLVDRCTFVRATDGALDITGDVSDVTVQRSLFYGTAKTMLIKYGSRSRISIHHNVFTRNGERNPQVKGDMQLLDFVNNVVHLNDVPAYPDGSSTSPYGLRLWSGGSGSDSPGNVVANVVGSAFLGAGAALELIEEPGASLSGVYLDGSNVYEPASNGDSSPRSEPNAIPAELRVTTLPVAELATRMLPFVGAPNRTPEDESHLDAVAAALP